MEQVHHKLKDCLFPDIVIWIGKRTWLERLPVLKDDDMVREDQSK